MKRLWIGAVLLAVLLALSLWVSTAMERTHRAGAEDLERAAALAAEGNWDGAISLTSRARARWEQKRHITASLADHEPMDEAEGLFAELEYYARKRESGDFSAASARLANLLKAISNSHHFSFPNFF